MSNVQQQALFQRHVPTAGFALTMGLVGSLINQWPAAQQNLLVGQDILCQNIPENASHAFNISSEDDTALMSAGQALAFFFAITLPLVPVVAQSPFPLNSWTREQQNFFTTHLIGQTGSFGSSELGRFFLVEPSPLFYSKCGLQKEDCIQRDMTYLNLLEPEDETKSLCQKNSTSLYDLYQNLHAMPDVRSAMMGAASVVFVAGLWFTVDVPVASREKGAAAGSEILTTKKRHFKNRNPFLKLVLILSFLVFVSWFLIERYKQLANSGAQIILSFVLGVVLQIFVNTFYQLKKRDDDTAEASNITGHNEEEEETEAREEQHRQRTLYKMKPLLRQRPHRTIKKVQFGTRSSSSEKQTTSTLTMTPTQMPTLEPTTIHLTIPPHLLNLPRPSATNKPPSPSSISSIIQD